MSEYSVKTFGPLFDWSIDNARLERQMDKIRVFMLNQDGWRTLEEIEFGTGYGQASISAQLRHLRKPEFGSYRLEKRRRTINGGLWEYKLARSEHGPVEP